MSAFENLENKIKAIKRQTSPDTDQLILEDMAAEFQRARKVHLAKLSSALLKIAAAVLIVAAIALALFNLSNKEQKKQYVTPDEKNQPKEIEEQIQPVEQKHVIRQPETTDKSQLKTEMEQVIAFAEASDVNGLFVMLESKEVPVQMLAATYLSRYNDLKVSQTLEKHAAEKYPNDPDNFFIQSAGKIKERLATKNKQEPNEVSIDDIKMRLYILDEVNEMPIEAVQIKYSCGCNCESKNYITDVNGFCQIDFGQKKPSYISITVTKPGSVPMMFSWQEKMIESLPEDFAFYLPKSKAIGGTIKNENDEPVPNAELFISMYIDNDRTEPWIRIDDYKVTTDANGSWECNVFPQQPHNFNVKLKHPEYGTTRIWINESQYKFEDFYNKKSVLVIKKGTIISGMVTSLSGIPIKNASVATGEDRFDNDSPKTKTDEQGRFEFKNYLPIHNENMVTLTIQAKGYAPELKLFSYQDDIESILIALGPPNTIKIHVVDINDQPIVGAGVDAERWRGKRSLSWNRKTNKKGRVTWNNAPADEVLIDIYHRNHMRISDQPLVANDQEYKLVMLPPLVISGNVIDDETNEPISDFAVTKGIRWENGSIHWKEPSQYGYDGQFYNGRYQMKITHPYPGHLLRIDAKGYLPQKSRVFDSNEASVSYNFRLKKGAGNTSIVYEPNNAPAANAQVYIVTNQYISFQNNKPTNRLDSSLFTQTAEDGTLFLKPLLSNSPYKLVIIHDKGFAELTKEQWLQDPNITLQKWGRVEGVLYSGLNVSPQDGIRLYTTHSYTADPNNIRYYYNIDTVTDSNGRFVMNKVKPGETKIARKITTNSGRTTTMSDSKTIEVIAGKTTNVEIGGGGRIVTGQLVKNSQIQNTTQLSYIGCSLTPSIAKQFELEKIYAEFDYPRPDNFDQMTYSEVTKWYRDWVASEEGKEFQQQIQEHFEKIQITHKNYNVLVENDGTFKVIDVLPGRYTLSANLRRPDRHGHSDYTKPIVAEIEYDFVVEDLTEENQNETVELGKLPLKKAEILEPNNPAPDFNIPALDGGTLRLSDFRGQYLLLTFFIPDDQGPFLTEMENLKNIQDDLSQDERFEMVGLTSSQMPLFKEILRKFLDEWQLTWQQGLLESMNYKLMQKYQINSWPHSLLIDPNGILLIKGLKGDELYDFVSDTLSK